MDYAITYSHAMAQRDTETDEESTASSTAKVLGKNLTTLMAAHKDLNSNPKLAKKTKLSGSTISRMRNGQVDANLDTLERLSQAFHVEPWQLLVPNVEAGNLPVLMPISEAERKLHDRLRELAKEMKESTR